jgi:hypothetical protein
MKKVSASYVRKAKRMQALKWDGVGAVESKEHHSDHEDEIVALFESLLGRKLGPIVASGTSDDEGEL